jgi:TolA-binding protein
MKIFFPTSLICVFLAGGCASTAQLREVESVEGRNEKILNATEQRVRVLEQGVSALGKQVEALDNRVYEVRTGSGRKTGMKVTPVFPPQTRQTGNQDARTGVSAPQNASVPGEQVNLAAPRTAPILTPSVPPLRIPSDGKDAAPAKNSAAVPPGGSGAAAPEPTAVALPPVEAPAIPLPSAALSPTAGQKAADTQASPPASTPSRPIEPAAAMSGSIPVPSLPLSDLPLPPEHPDLPPVAPPLQVPAARPPAMPKGPVPADAPAISGNTAGKARTKDTAESSPKTGQGEESVYKAALSLAMSGRSAEGISQFRSFLQRYPNGRYAPNAEYWIGECLSAQKNYQDALAQFQLVNTQ